MMIKREDIIGIILSLSHARTLDDLRKRDLEICENTRKMGCPYCCGPLHRADYPRSPRGGELMGSPDGEKRCSLCCADCRTRTTPPSVRFLGRRWYWSPAVIITCTATLMADLWELCGKFRVDRSGVPKRTQERWLGWWGETFPESPAFAAVSGLCAPGLDKSRLPLSLFEKTRVRGMQALDALLGVLKPLSAPAVTKKVIKNPAWKTGVVPAG